MKIKILESANQDLIAGFKFYEMQSEGLGTYFIDSLFSDIDSLLLYADVHADWFSGYKRLLSKRFPFSIYYRVDAEDV